MAALISGSVTRVKSSASCRRICTGSSKAWRVPRPSAMVLAGGVDSSLPLCQLL